MSRSILFFLIIIYFPTASAETDHELGEELRVLKKIDLQENKKAYVVVREGGHLLGQPFQVELRVQCDGVKKEIKELPVYDSYSVCDLSPKSLKINKQKTAVAMKVKSADVTDYYDQLDRGIASPQVRCHSATAVKKFSLRKLCK